MYSRLVLGCALFGVVVAFTSCDPDFPVTIPNPTFVVEIGSNELRVQFAVPSPSFVTIVLQNMAGDEVRTLFAESVQAGFYVATAGLSGVDCGRYYFITLKNGSDVRSFLIKLV